jgi:hypothetical protein
MRARRMREVFIDAEALRIFESEIVIKPSE